MSDIKFNCPHCKQSLEAPEDLLGQVLDCPSCNKKIQVPKSQMRAAPQAALQNVSVEIKRGANPMGIAALVLGILACLTCWIPIIGLLSIPLSLIGLLLGFIGLIMAAVSKKTGFAFPISGGLVCVVAIFIAISSTGGCAKAVSDAADRAQKTNQSVVPSDPEAQTPPSYAQPANPPTETETPAPPPKPTEQWTSAANAVRQGDVQIRISGVRIGTVALKDMFGDRKESKDALLTITLEITNLSTGKKLDFGTWRGADFSFGEDFASLTDDNDNTYKRINFGVSSVPVGGVDRESIYPGKSITDVLVYEVPVDTAKWLRLKLPARNFKGDGMLRFEIPASMIQR